MRFRLSTMLWVTALLASGMAAFGLWGIPAAAFVIWYWADGRRRGKTIEWLIICAIVLVLIGLLLPAVQCASEYSRVAHCFNNIKNLVLALNAHRTEHGSLPPSTTRDDKPPRSWRTLILPYLDQQQLYAQYRHTQRWNSPANRTVTAPLDIFMCPSDPPVWVNSAQTNYFAIVGHRTAWPEDRTLKPSEIIDDPATTILLIEAASTNIAWPEPRDLTFDEAVTLLSSSQSPYLPLHTGSINVAMANGSVMRLGTPMPKDLAIALLTVNGGEPIDPEEIPDPQPTSQGQSWIIALAAFAALTLLPTFRRRSATQASAASP